MQRLLEIPQEACNFLRNFRLRAGDLNREGGSKTAPLHTSPARSACSSCRYFYFATGPVFCYSGNTKPLHSAARL